MESSAPRPERIAGRYQVQAQLGRGGMGVIYRVHDDRTQRDVALKRLRAEKVGSSENAALLRAHFEREYYTLSQLAHPRIIEVYDYGFVGPDPYYTMELLDGQDLFERGQLAWPVACAVLRDVASSLAILHSRRLVHRDVSARNVRLTGDGRAKLIDFGAMSPMGPVKHVVGTPPFLPPEALEREALDARSDLYALGVLAYWVLTRYYPYPARSLDDLRGLWREVPLPPSQRGIQLPRALEALVMQLLELEREARPGSAAEVMERLSGIAGLPLSELPQVTKAYLNMPTLIGREAQLEQVRKLLRAGHPEHTASAVIEGDEGTGRTRFLEACRLEAKLLGATVLHADATDGAGAELGVARELAKQAFQALPELAERCARHFRSQLATLLPNLITAAPGAPRPDSLHPRRVQTALNDWMLSMVRVRPIAIAVDDVDSIDEASLRWLQALAIASGRNGLTLLLTSRNAQTDGRLETLREHATIVTLAELDRAKTHALLQSVFGDVDHVAGIATRIHDVAHGNPRWTMLLAETLVERGLARYEAGSWALPAQLTSSDLPDSLNAALASAIAALPGDARALAEALSLTEPALLPSDRYAELLNGADQAHALKALHALLERRVLAPEGAGYRFAQRELAEQLRATLSPARAAELHARLAQAALATGDAVLIARHELLSGDGRAAIERLVPLSKAAEPSFSARMLDVLQLAVDAAHALGLTATAEVVLQPWLLAQAGVLGELALFKRHAQTVLARLERDSGLRDYLESDPAQPEHERLQQALAAAQARYDALPEHARALPPSGAAWQLGRMCSVVVGMAAVANDLALLEGLPVLTPLAPVYPAFDVSQKHIETQLHMQSGRFDLASKATRELLELLDRPEYPLDPLHATELRNTAFYVLGLMGASYGMPDVERNLAAVEHVPGLRVPACRARMIAQIALGDPEGAAKFRKQAEVMLQEDAGRLPYPGTTAATELVIYSAADDLVATKRAMERIIPLAERFPGWRAQLELARADYLRIQGDARGALAIVTAALELAPPGRHSTWGRLAELHVRVLSLAGNHEEAVARGYAYLGITQAQNLASAAVGLLRAVAEALAAAGRPTDALPLIEQNLRVLEQMGARGVMLGRSLETRARVAIALRDEAGFHTYAERCAREYKGAFRHGPRGKYERLAREAQDAGLVVNTSLLQITDLRSEPAAGQERTSPSDLLAGLEGQARAQEGLRLLLEYSGAETGFVFALIDDTLELRASSDARPPDAMLIQALRAFVQRVQRAEESSTTYDTAVTQETGAGALVDAAGRRFRAAPLYGREGGELVVSGVAALHYAAAERSVLRHDLLDAIGGSLLHTEISGV